MTQPLRLQLSQMISDLKAGVLKLNATILENVDTFVTLLKDENSLEDEVRRDTVSKFKANDLAVHALGDTLENETVKILSLQAPVSRDLRLALSSFRMIYDLQRIARDIRHAFVGIAKFKSTNHQIFMKFRTEFIDSVNSVKKMLELFRFLYELEVRERDFEYDEYVVQTEELDDVIDELFEVHSKKIIQKANEKEVDVELAHRLLGAIRSLERVGDHCCNIIERAIYIKSGYKVVID